MLAAQPYGFISRRFVGPVCAPAGKPDSQSADLIQFVLQTLTFHYAPFYDDVVFGCWFIPRKIIKVPGQAGRLSGETIVNHQAHATKIEKSAANETTICCASSPSLTEKVYVCWLIVTFVRPARQGTARLTGWVTSAQKPHQVAGPTLTTSTNQ